MDSIPSHPRLCIPPRFRDALGIFAPGKLRLRSRGAEDLALNAEEVRGSETFAYTRLPRSACMRPQERGSRMTRRSTVKAKEQNPALPAPASTVPKIPPAQVLPRLAALQTATAAELREQWRALSGKEPPPFNRPCLVSRLSYRVQELAYGGLKPETRARLEALGEQLDGGNLVLRRIRADSRPLPGTRLVREYDGVQHVVTVRADNFEYEGRPYRSLSAIARHITGTRWIGWTFFGLKGRPGA